MLWWKIISIVSTTVAITTIFNYTYTFTLCITLVFHGNNNNTQTILDYMYNSNLTKIHQLSIWICVVLIDCDDSTSVNKYNCTMMSALHCDRNIIFSGLSVRDLLFRHQKCLKRMLTRTISCIRRITNSHGNLYTCNVRISIINNNNKCITISYHVSCLFSIAFAMEQDIPDYDMDSEDERWLVSQAKKLDLTPLKFEEMMDRLEKSSGQTVVTLNEAKALLKEDDDLIDHSSVWLLAE